VSRNNGGTSGEINACRDSAGSDHHSQHSAGHQLLKQEAPNQELPSVVRAHSSCYQRRVLWIASNKFGIEVVFSNDLLNLILDPLLVIKSEHGVGVSRKRFNISIALFTSGSKENSRQELVALKLSENDRYWKLWI
jgi:hypothetical protein